MSHYRVSPAGSWTCERVGDPGTSGMPSADDGSGRRARLSRVSGLRLAGTVRAQKIRSLILRRIRGRIITRVRSNSLDSTPLLLSWEIFESHRSAQEAIAAAGNRPAPRSAREQSVRPRRASGRSAAPGSPSPACTGSPGCGCRGTGVRGAAAFIPDERYRTVNVMTSGSAKATTTMVRTFVEGSRGGGVHVCPEHRDPAGVGDDEAVQEASPPGVRGGPVRGEAGDSCPDCSPTRRRIRAISAGGSVG